MEMLVKKDKDLSAIVENMKNALGKISLKMSECHVFVFRLVMQLEKANDEIIFDAHQNILTSLKLFFMWNVWNKYDYWIIALFKNKYEVLLDVLLKVWTIL